MWNIKIINKWKWLHTLAIHARTRRSHMHMHATRIYIYMSGTGNANEYHQTIKTDGREGQKEGERKSEINMKKWNRNVSAQDSYVVAWIDRGTHTQILAIKSFNNYFNISFSYTVNVIYIGCYSLIFACVILCSCISRLKMFMLCDY